MIIKFKELLHDAYQNHYIVGYFESWDVYSLEAVIEAAEEELSPVVIGFGGHTMNFNWFGSRGIERLGAMGRKIAENSRVPVSFLLNEIPSIPMAVKGIRAGFNAVMLDTGGESFETNVLLTQQIVEIAHDCGVGVEGELGVLGDERYLDSHDIQMTDPIAAAKFVDLTGIDALSVSIGNIHLRVETEATVDLTHLKAIHEAIEIPLVLHGGSSLPEHALSEMTQLGLSKINVGTILKKSFLNGMHAYFENLEVLDNYHQRIGCRDEFDILMAGKNAMKKEVSKRIRAYRGTRSNL
jgi:fructose-bisphosphate aldolase class II